MAHDPLCPCTVCERENRRSWRADLWKAGLFYVGLPVLLIALFR